MKSRLLILSGILLSACAVSPPSPLPKAAAPPVPLLIATPVDDSGPASIEARLNPKDDSQMLLRFTVAADGKVQDALVLMSKLSEETDTAVLAAFRGLSFRPYEDAGKPVAHEFIYPLFFGPDAVSERTRFFCRHEDERYRPESRCDIVTNGAWRVYRVTPPYPSGLSERVSGAVTLAFDLDAGGVPSNVKVLKSEPPGVFDTAAVVALQQWYFETLDGSTPTTVQHATVAVNFTPPPASKPSGGP
jgi:TonB family protein